MCACFLRMRARVRACDGSFAQVVNDEQVQLNGGFVDLELNEQDVREGTAAIRSLNNPVDFDGVHDTKRPAAPGR
jgi:hypothetical protein